MRRSFVIILGIAAMGFSVSHGADTGIVPKPPAGFDPFKSTKGDMTPTPKVSLLPHLEIVKNSFVAKRFSNKIVVKGMVKNFAVIAGDNGALSATWTIFRAAGAKWVPVQSGYF